jgi:hypothetical protein
MDIRSRVHKLDNLDDHIEQPFYKSVHPRDIRSREHKPDIRDDHLELLLHKYIDSTDTHFCVHT